MLSKTVLDALRDDFNEEFEKLSQKDDYIQTSICELLSLVGNVSTFTEAQENNIMDAVQAVISSSSCLGFSIGLKEGTNILQSLLNPSLPELTLKAYGELIE